MSRFQFHTLFAGATAIALVMAPPAYAQQSDDQSGDAQVQQQAGSPDMQGAEARTRIGDRLEAARTALDDENADDARQALDEAADELSIALEGQDQPSEAWQRLDERLSEARDALDGDDMQAASDALDEAETAFTEAAGDETQQQAAAGSGQQGEPEVEAAAPGRQPVPALEEAELDQQQAAAEGGQQQAGQQQAGTALDQQAATEVEEAAAAAEGREPIPQGADTGAEGQQAEGEQQAATEGEPADITMVEGQQQTATEGQQQAATEGEPADITVVEGEQAVEGDVEVKEVEAEVTDVTVIEGEAAETAEPAAGTQDATQAGTQAAEAGQDGEFAAEVVRGDELSVEETNELLTVNEPVGSPAEMLSVAPGDLEGRDVVTFEGDSIGEVEQLVLSQGEVHAIVAHGGFLGIGRDRVAVPASRLGMRGEEVVLLGLSEEQLDAMPEFDFQTGQVVPEGQMLDMGRYD